MSDESCAVCGQLGQGNHFGVVSCRACAAFFRRAANSKWSTMECLSRHCDENSYNCKPCRVKRCRAVGMDTSKFQHDRDSIVVRRKRKLLPTFEQFVGRPHVVLICNNSPTTSKTFIDVSILMESAKEIMRMGCETPLIARNHLEKLGHGVRCLSFVPEPKFVEKMTRVETTGLWEFYFLATARWLTHFEPFQELHDELKFKLLLAVWHVWCRLHKLMATALYRTRHENTKPSRRVAGNGLLTDISRAKADTGWMSRYPPEQVTFFLTGMRGADFYPIILKLEKMGMTETEMTFMLAQLCFQYASQRFGGEISEKMDQFQEILTNDLHSYYVEEMNTIRYSGRLLKMLKINNDIQENIRKHRARGEIARVFEIFALEFSHPEMFEDTGIN